jgi:hypothetical protein
MNLATDGNGNPVQALRPYTAVNITDSTHSISNDGVVRMTASSDSSYGVNEAATVVLPAGVVEYIRVIKGDVIYIVGTVNIGECT